MKLEFGYKQELLQQLAISDLSIGTDGHIDQCLLGMMVASKPIISLLVLLERHECFEDTHKNADYREHRDDGLQVVVDELVYGDPQPPLSPVGFNMCQQGGVLVGDGS